MEKHDFNDNEEKKFVTTMEKAVKKISKRRKRSKYSVMHTVRQFLLTGGMPWLTYGAVY